MRARSYRAHVALASAMIAPACLIAQDGPRSSSDDSYRAGIGLLRKGMHDLAAKELLAYLDTAPSGEHAMHARYALAVCFVQQGRCKDAMEKLAGVLDAKDFEFAADVRLLCARCAFDAGEDRQVVDLLTLLSREHSEFAQLDQGIMLLGESLYRLGRDEEAAKTLAGLRQRWPQSPLADRADLFTAMGLQRTGYPREALDRARSLLSTAPKSDLAGNAALIAGQCAQALADAPLALEMYDLASSRGPEDVRFESRLALAELARARGDATRAARALDGLDVARGGAPVANATRLALARAWLLLDEGRPDDARSILTAIDAAPPFAPDIALALARADLLAGKPDAAAQRLAWALEHFPTSALVPRLRFDLGSALSRAGDDAHAIEQWRAWLRDYPAHELTPDALASFAWCLHRAKNYHASSERGDEFLQHYSAHPSREGVELLIAENAYALGDFAVASQRYDAFTRAHATSPLAARAHVHGALCLLRTGDVAGGERMLRDALDSHPAPDGSLRCEALAIAGELAMTRKDWPSGERWFGALADGDKDSPRSLDARLRQGICIARQDRPKDAALVLARVADDTKAGDLATRARIELAHCLLALDRAEDARATLTRVIEDSAVEPSLAAHARRELAGLAARQGKPEEAAHHLAAITKGEGDQIELASAWLAAGKPEEACRVLRAYLDAAKNDPAPRRARASVLLSGALNRLDRSEAALGALPADRELAALDDETRAAASQERAIALLRLHRTDEAMTTYRDLAEHAPSRWRAHAHLALAQADLERSNPQSALVHARAVQENAEGLATPEREVILQRAAYFAASALLAMDKPGDALDALGAVPKESRDAAMERPLALLRAQALFNSGQARQAAETFAALAGTTERDDLTRNAALRAGEAWAACEDWKRSEQSYRAFLDAYPDSPLWFHAMFGIAWAREHDARPDAAIEAYRQVMTRHNGPTAARAQFQIGECLFAEKNLEQAVAEFLKVDVLYSSEEWTPAALYEAGRCLAQLKRSDDAARQFDELLARFPNSRWAALARGAKADAPAPPSPRAAEAARPVEPAPTADSPRPSRRAAESKDARPSGGSR